MLRAKDSGLKALLAGNVIVADCWRKRRGKRGNGEVQERAENRSHRPTTRKSL